MNAIATSFGHSLWTGIEGADAMTITSHQHQETLEESVVEMKESLYVDFCDLSFVAVNWRFRVIHRTLSIYLPW